MSRNDLKYKKNIRLIVLKHRTMRHIHVNTHGIYMVNKALVEVE